MFKLRTALLAVRPKVPTLKPDCDRGFSFVDQQDLHSPRPGDFGRDRSSLRLETTSLKESY
jgi:hypothetical protein